MIYNRESKGGIVTKQAAIMNKACCREDRVTHFNNKGITCNKEFFNPMENKEQKWKTVPPAKKSVNFLPPVKKPVNFFGHSIPYSPFSSHFYRDKDSPLGERFLYDIPKREEQKTTVVNNYYGSRIRHCYLNQQDTLFLGL